MVERWLSAPKTPPGQPGLRLQLAKRSGSSAASAFWKSMRIAKNSSNSKNVSLRTAYGAKANAKWPTRAATTRNTVGLGNNTKHKQTHQAQQNKARTHELYSKCITSITMVMGYHIPSSAQGQRVTVAEIPPPQKRGPDHLRRTEFP